MEIISLDEFSDNKVIEHMYLSFALIIISSVNFISNVCVKNFLWCSELYIFVLILLVLFVVLRMLYLLLVTQLSSVLWHCWLVVRKSIWPVKYE